MERETRLDHRYLHLGKGALYQMSYTCTACVWLAEGGGAGLALLLATLSEALHGPLRGCRPLCVNRIVAWVYPLVQGLVEAPVVVLKLGG